MTAPTYHLHPISGGNVYLGECGTEDFGDPVPAVVLTASDEDVERLARAIAAGQEVRWGDLDEGTRFSRLTHARAYIAALLAPPVPPEPTDLAWRGVDRHGVTWARFADGWGCPEDSETYPWADLWAERGPLREVGA